MNDHTCEFVRPALPEWVRGSLDADAGVERHLASCSECRAEAHVLRALMRTRPEPPSGLAERIQEAVRADRPAPRSGQAQRGVRGPDIGRVRLLARSGPGLAAAAVLVLALGTAVIWPQVRDGTPPALPDTPVEEELFLGPWAGDAGIVAGAPVFEELTDEELLTLLEELEG